METASLKNKFKKKVFVFFLILMCATTLISSTYIIIWTPVTNYRSAKASEEALQHSLKEEEPKNMANAAYNGANIDMPEDQVTLLPSIEDVQTGVFVGNIQLVEVKSPIDSLEKPDQQSSSWSFNPLGLLFHILPGFVHFVSGLAFSLYGALRVSKKYGRSMFGIFAGTSLLSGFLATLANIFTKVVIEALFENTTVHILGAFFYSFVLNPLFLACLYLLFKIITDRNQRNGAELEPLRLRKMLDLDEPMVRITLVITTFNVIYNFALIVSDLFGTPILQKRGSLLAQDIGLRDCLEPVLSNFWYLFRGDAIYQLVYGILCYAAVMLILNRLLVHENRAVAIAESKALKEEGEATATE